MKLIRTLFFVGILMTSASARTTEAITFRAEAELRKALEPLSLEEVTDCIAASQASVGLEFRFDSHLVAPKTIPLRNRGTGNLIKTELYKTKTLTVFSPETPRVPNHLTIALNRKGITGISEVSEEENAELFVTIKKIAEIYKTLSIQGFVIAQFDRPQEGHLDRHVVEVIPHLPGFGSVKNIVDKVGCNGHVLFRDANISPITYEIKADEVSKQTEFWQAAFGKEQALLSESDVRVTFPYTRHESHQKEAERVLFHQLIEILQDRGGKVTEEIPFEDTMPTTIPETIKSVTAAKCFFCDDSVIKNQLVYQYKDIAVFYNMRKGAGVGRCFLILPKRHIEKVYGLTSEEIRDIGMVRRALVEVLRESHPECEVVIYTQDNPAVGQTVFHSHEQVAAIDSKTIGLTWTMMSLYPSGNVSPEEMRAVCEEIGRKIAQKVETLEPQEKVA